MFIFIFGIFDFEENFFYSDDVGRNGDEFFCVVSVCPLQ